jgi:hypothetical protein
VVEVKTRPLSGGVPGHPELDRALEAASVHGYRWGLGVGGGLMMLGGVISLLGIVNPARAARLRRDTVHGPSELTYPCPEQRREAELAGAAHR